MSKRKTYDEEFKKTLVNLILNVSLLKRYLVNMVCLHPILFFGEKNIVILIPKVMRLSLSMTLESFKKN